MNCLKLKELRFIFNSTTPKSEPITNYLTKNYANLKQKYNNIPILIRECDGINSMLYARFDYGKELKYELDNLTEENISNIVSKINNN